jgi:YgiT-type zinc finger domain-containing protein
MKCHTCGGELEKIVTDLPFKVSQGSIIIIKRLPVLQCRNCSEYLIKDPVMQKVDKLLNKVNTAVEVKILNYAA